MIYSPQLETVPGSFIGKSGQSHHAYRGGLATHTLEATQNALAMADSQALTVDKEVLVVAAVVHDFMKTREYILHLDTSIEKTEYKQLVRHVAGSHAWFVSMCYELDYADQDKQVQIEHAILAHHGRLEWKTPVEPQTVKAMILHYADMVSSNYGKAKQKVSNN